MRSLRAVSLLLVAVGAAHLVLSRLYHKQSRSFGLAVSFVEFRLYVGVNISLSITHSHIGMFNHGAMTELTNSQQKITQDKKLG